MADGGSLLSAELRLAGRLDARFFALLQAIHDTGSINKAARTAGLSYKGAWLMLESAGNLAHEPLLRTERGGTTLTAAALALLNAWRTLQHDHREFLRAQESRLAHMQALQGLLRRMSMKTTARNQFAGVVKAVQAGPVSATVTIALKSAPRAGLARPAPRGGLSSPAEPDLLKSGEIVATMTAEAAKRLKLRKGKEALALVKASAVVLVSDFAGWQLSARNQLAGTVSRIERGAVSSLVVLTLPGGVTLTASVTNEGVEALALKVGAAATAVFKAYAVMVAAQP